MTDKPTPKLPSGQTIKWIDTQLVSHYANIMALSMTPFDISVTFGEIGVASPTEVEALAKAKIVLSPEQASNLMKLLSVAVEQYTAGNGNLRVSGALDPEAFAKSLEVIRMGPDNEGK